MEIFRVEVLGVCVSGVYVRSWSTIWAGDRSIVELLSSIGLDKVRVVLGECREGVIL